MIEAQGGPIPCRYVGEFSFTLERDKAKELGKLLQELVKESSMIATIQVDVDQETSSVSVFARRR